jgi:hypothetical protein
MYHFQAERSSQDHSLKHLIVLFKSCFQGTTQRTWHLALALMGPPLWSSGQSFWLQLQRSRVRLPVLQDFLSSSGSGTGSTQTRFFVCFISNQN